jgi:hypothetical protein
VQDLADAPSCVPRMVARMQTEEHLRLVTLDLFVQLREDNLPYAEFL